MIFQNVYALAQKLNGDHKPRRMAGCQVALYEIANSDEPVPGDFQPKNIAVRAILPKAPLQPAVHVSASTTSSANPRQNGEAELQAEPLQSGADEDESEDGGPGGDECGWEDLFSTWEMMDMSGDEEHDGPPVARGQHAQQDGVHGAPTYLEFLALE